MGGRPWEGAELVLTLSYSLSARARLTLVRLPVLVVAAGRAGLVQRDWVKPGACVIDVGINFTKDASKKSGQRMVGDVAPEVNEVAGHLTPVPGGVGPMTVAMLMQNTLEARRRLAEQVSVITA